MKRQISERHARALIAIKDQPLQLEILQLAIDNDWNVRQLEEHIQGILHPVADEQEETIPKSEAKT